VVEVRGAAETVLAVDRLGVNLRLEAEATGADPALAQLQRRLDRVRRSLQALGVEELRVGAPSTWERPAVQGRPALVRASLAISGRLNADRLQGLIREVGGLPGVRLGTVTPMAEPERADLERRRLVQGAYEDARRQALAVAAAAGLGRLVPLELRLDPQDGGPSPRRLAATAAEAAPFDPDELPAPQLRQGLQARFCAR
jgi:uncharacterized protein YggE